ncbi:hypothetical protein ACO0LC_27845 [Undibacterium sp. JH2W]|uniref:hypothetical protein n=1 Tax=Undibacterium sp. JH2W TaxID=3413037 RepID=UPI003BF0A4B9
MFKFIVDKGALALLFVLIGVVTTKMLERYKWALNREQELVKLSLPVFSELMLDAEKLFRDCHSVIPEMWDKYAIVVAWLDNLLATPYQLNAVLPNGADARNAKLVLANENTYGNFRRGSKTNDDSIIDSSSDAIMLLRAPIIEVEVQEIDSGFTLIDLMMQATDDPILLKFIVSDGLWTDETAHKPGGFLNTLGDALSVRHKDRDEITRANLLLVLPKIFAKCNFPTQENYLQAVQDFHFKMLRGLDPRTRRQEKALMRVVEALILIENSFKAFPSNDVLKGLLKSDTTMLKVVSSSYGAILTQLRVFIRNERW